MIARIINELNQSDCVGEDVPNSTIYNDYRFFYFRAFNRPQSNAAGNRTRAKNLGRVRLKYFSVEEKRRITCAFEYLVFPVLELQFPSQRFHNQTVLPFLSLCIFDGLQFIYITNRSRNLFQFPGFGEASAQTSEHQGDARAYVVQANSSQPLR